MQNKNKAPILSCLLWSLGVCLAPGGWARDTSHAHGNAAHDKPAMHTLSQASMACKVSISPKEDREVIILKLQQRMDCLEVKLDELNREVTVLRAR